MTEEPFNIHEEDKVMFLKTLNSSGFLLEDRTWKILTESNFFDNRIIRGQVYSHKNERVEIDFIAQKGGHIFIIECKKTEYSWIFPLAQERRKSLNLITKKNGKITCESRTKSDENVSWFDLAIKFENGRVARNHGLAQMSTKDTHDKIRQILKETEAFLDNTKENNVLIFPIIITNADLLVVDYTKAQINDKGDLEDYGYMKKVGWLFYNFAEVMTAQGQNIGINTTEGTDYSKSVLIINLQNLNNFLRDYDLEILDGMFWN